ncbi:MAG: PD-(D/E)XK nuclease family transposase, partial [Puniceicoccales bacterium]|nr:PD-(D/E)XK nuclease family transposase [Puniceicoccales bacterium]
NQYNVVVSNKIRLFYIQLPLFKKEEGELSDRRDKWLYSLKNLEELEAIPTALATDPVFQKFYGNAEDAGVSPAVRKALAYELKVRRDSYSATEARVDGARAEGRAEGIAEGIAEGKHAVVRNMKALGLAAEIIAQATGLSVEEIQKI